MTWPFWYPGWYDLYGFRDYYYGGYPSYYGYYGYYGGLGSSYPYDVAVSETYGYAPAVTDPTVTAVAPPAEVPADAMAVPAQDPAAEAAPAEAAPPPAPADAAVAAQYFVQARQAFQAENYRDALRLSSHTAIETPRDAQVHELMSLALFALKEYRGAAIETHAVITLGRASDWPTVFGYYGNVDTYTRQFRELEKFVRENPKAAEGRFLLGYHCLLTNNQDAAKRHLTEAVALTPQDEIAKQLLKKL